MDITFEIKDYSDELLSKLKKNIDTFLEESKMIVSSQASLNSPVDTGALSRSFLTDSYVDTSEQTAYIGSSLDYAYYQEYGTGEYALSGGRQGGWHYQSPDGTWHFTKGSHPNRMLYRAMTSSKGQLENRLKSIMGG